jgi:hypothetical protein
VDRVPPRDRALLILFEQIAGIFSREKSSGCSSCSRIPSLRAALLAAFLAYVVFFHAIFCLDQEDKSGAPTIKSKMQPLHTSPQNPFMVSVGVMRHGDKMRRLRMSAF